MNQRTRMFRVWACLVIAMTGGSALLSWMVDASGRAAITLQSRRTEEHARKAVSSPREPLTSWRDVLLIPVLSGESEQRQATDTTLHFEVSADGVVGAHAAWLQQRRLDDASHIHVGLRVSDVSGRMERGQWTGLEALLDALNAQRSDLGANVPLPLKLHPGWRGALRGVSGDSR